MQSTPRFGSPRPPRSLRQRFRTSPALWGGVGLAALLALGLTPAASAQAPGSPDVAEPSAVAPDTAPAEAPAAGLRIYVDPETGELTSTPTPEQAERLSAALAPLLERPVEEPVLFEIPGGGTGVFVGRRFASAMVVRVKADGTFELGCADRDHAHQLLAAPPAAAGAAAAAPPTTGSPAYAVK